MNTEREISQVHCLDLDESVKPSPELTAAIGRTGEKHPDYFVLRHPWDGTDSAMFEGLRFFIVTCVGRGVPVFMKLNDGQVISVVGYEAHAPKVENLVILDHEKGLSALTFDELGELMRLDGFVTLLYPTYKSQPDQWARLARWSKTQ